MPTAAEASPMSEENGLDDQEKYKFDLPPGSICNILFVFTAPPLYAAAADGDVSSTVRAHVPADCSLATVKKLIQEKFPRTVPRFLYEFEEYNWSDDDPFNGALTLTVTAIRDQADWEFFLIFAFCRWAGTALSGGDPDDSVSTLEIKLEEAAEEGEIVEAEAEEGLVMFKEEEDAEESVNYNYSFKSLFGGVDVGSLLEMELTEFESSEL
ncbi:hypothetical protein RUND412_008429 [Rhizina undulata]